MPFSIYDTYYMLAALREMPLEQNFFKRRYFPTNENLDVFGTTKVLIDYKSEGRHMADFVLPRLGPISVGREGFSTYELEPGNISISRPLTLDQLTQRGFGESLMSNLKPEERARMLLMEDLSELNNRITRTEEKLAIDTIISNGATMRHVTENPDIYQDVKVQFYDGDDNPALYTPAAKWEHSVLAADGIKIGSWYYDIVAMIKMLTRRGLPATDLVISPDVAEFIMEDPWVVAMHDNRRIDIGRIDQNEMTPYVTDFGVINFGGHRLDVIVNENTYEADDGTEKPLMEPGTVFVTAANCGKGLYGAVTQLNENDDFQTYTGTRVPDYIVTRRPPAKEIALTCRPLYVPRRPSPWSVAVKVFDADP